MRVIRNLVVCVLAAACGPDRAVSPKPPTDPAAAEEPAATLSASELAALAAAIADARAWLLPFVGDEAATQALGAQFADLATSLERAENSVLTTRIAAARRELDALTAEPSADPFIESAALGLALDGVEAVLQGRLRLVPFEAVPDASPDARRAANEPTRPTLERSLP